MDPKVRARFEALERKVTDLIDEQDRERFRRRLAGAMLFQRWVVFGGLALVLLVSYALIAAILP